MSFEAALYELTGAGLVACAPGLGLAVPPGAVRSGDAFVGFLSQRGAWGEINALVEELKRTVREDAAQAMTSEAGLVQQMAEAVTCLEEFRLEPELLRTALTPSIGPGGGAPGSDLIAPATRIAAQLVARSAAAHPPHLHAASAERPAAGPSLGAQQLLHRLMAQLLRNPFLIIGLAPALQEYLSLTEQSQPAAIAAVDPAPAAGAAFGSATAAPSFQLPRVPAAPTATPTLAAVRLVLAPGVTIAPVLAGIGLGEAFASALTQTGAAGALDAIRVARKLTPAAFARSLQTLESQACPPQTAALRLDEMAEWLENLVEALGKPSNEDSETRRLKAAAARALTDGDLEAAMQHLKNVRRSAREDRRRIEERLREDVQQLDAQMSQEAAIIARQADMELTRRAYAAAAELYADARDCLPRNDVQSAWLYAMRQGEALFRLGDEFDDTRALGEAVRIYGGCLTLTSKTEAPRNWAAAQCGIALSRLRLAERRTDPQELRTSIEAWRAALAVLDGLTASPAEAGQILVSRRHFARALTLAGERTGDIAALDEAADLYRGLITGLSVERNALDWAEAQMGLASTRLLRDEHAGEAQQGAGFAEATAALDAALGVYTREASPAQWAMARMNKGNLLLALGERERSGARYEAAVTCFEDALSVQGRVAAPGDRALIQTNLANAHAAIGEQTRDPQRLEMAASAYREAIDALSTPDDAMRRAIAELNLGTVLVRLAEIRDAQHHWIEAMGVMLSALDTFKANNADQYVRIAEINLRNLHQASKAATGLARDQLKRA